MGTVALRMESLKERERERAQGPLVHPVSAQGLSLDPELIMQVTLSVASRDEKSDFQKSISIY